MSRAALTLLVFSTGGEDHAVDASCVEEVVPAVPVIALPGAPAAVQGVVEVGGSVAPVLDGHLCFGAAPRSTTSSDHFIVVRTPARVVVLAVDHVTEVIAIADADVEHAPVSSTAAHVIGAARLRGGLVPLHDVSGLLRPEDARALAAAEAAARRPLPAADPGAGGDDELRAVLDRRPRRRSSPSYGIDQAELGIDVVSFHIGNDRYAIECRYVHSIVRLDERTPVPGLPPYFVGLANVRGEILPLVDLPRFLDDLRSDRAHDERWPGASSPSLGPAPAWRGHALILRDRDNELGVTADTVDDVIRVPASDLTQHAETAPLVRGVAGDGVTVIDGAALLADPRWSEPPTDDGPSHEPPAS